MPSISDRYQMEPKRAGPML